jgi:hypothetical protein
VPDPRIEVTEVEWATDLTVDRARRLLLLLFSAPERERGDGGRVGQDEERDEGEAA